MHSRLYSCALTQLQLRLAAHCPPLQACSIMYTVHSHIFSMILARVKAVVANPRHVEFCEHERYPSTALHNAANFMHFTMCNFVRGWKLEIFV